MSKVCQLPLEHPPTQSQQACITKYFESIFVMFLLCSIVHVAVLNESKFAVTRIVVNSLVIINGTWLIKLHHSHAKWSSYM